MTYDHTQKSPLYLIVLAPILLLTVIALIAHAHLHQYLILSCVAAVLVFFAFCFVSLRVRDEGDSLAIRFGPLPVFRRRIPYAQITAAEPGRSSIIDGWGIHWGPGREWIWNLWGFDCVVVHLGAKTVRIGTDDPAGLTEFINSKIADAALRQ